MTSPSWLLRKETFIPHRAAFQVQPSAREPGIEKPSPVCPLRPQLRARCSPLSFSPRLMFVAASLPATTGGDFIPVRQSVLPLAGSGYCQGITGQRKTFLGQWFNQEHLLQGDAECMVSVSFGLFSCVLLYRCLKAKGGPLKKDILRSQQGILAALKGRGLFSCLFSPLCTLFKAGNSICLRCCRVEGPQPPGLCSWLTLDAREKECGGMPRWCRATQQAVTSSFGAMSP